jgi:MraZ protein
LKEVPDVLFTGSHPQTIDKAGRIAIPAKLVPLMRSTDVKATKDSFEVVVSVGTEGRIGIYPVPYYQNLLSYLNAIPENDLVGQEVRRSHLNYMDMQSTDKQNRVRIPQLLADYYSLEGEVVVMGSGEFLEVVSKDDWRMHLEARASMFREHRGALGRYLTGGNAAQPATPGGQGIASPATGAPPDGSGHGTP